VLEPWSGKIANRLEWDGDVCYLSVFFSSFLVILAYPIKEGLCSLITGITISAGLLVKKASRERIPL